VMFGNFLSDFDVTSRHQQTAVAPISFLFQVPVQYVYNHRRNLDYMLK